MDICYLCHKKFIDGEAGYNGLYHYYEVAIDGKYICVSCRDKYLDYIKKLSSIDSYIKYNNAIRNAEIVASYTGKDEACNIAKDLALSIVNLLS